jgi:type I restriction enzyme M protein
MSDLPDVVSLTEIAVLTGVSPAAVSNWRRRHHDFPLPVRGSSPPAFPSEQVLAWLDERPVPSSNLAPGEDVSTTYADRVRAGPAGRRTTASTDKNATTGDGPAEEPLEAVWWRLSDALQGEEPPTRTDILASLFYTKATDPNGWRRIVEAVRRREPAAVGVGLTAVWGDLPDAPEWLRRLTGDRTGESLAPVVMTVVETLDRIGWESADEVGHTGSPASARIFSHLLRVAESHVRSSTAVMTPAGVAHTMAALVDPDPGASVYDPCCRAGDLLAAVADTMRRHEDARAGSSFTGLSLTGRSQRLATMNLALHDVTADLGHGPADALHDDVHQARHFDVIVTNPPFNMAWHPDDGRSRTHWRYAAPPRHSANFAWMQHVAEKLAPGGHAAILMPTNAGMSESLPEQQIRSGLLRDDLVEGLVALPAQLFAGTAIPVTLWLLHRAPRRRPGHVLFLDATDLGTMISRTQRSLSPAEIDTITSTFDRWRQGHDVDAAGWAQAVPAERLLSTGAWLNPRAQVEVARPHAGHTPIQEVVRRHSDQLHRLMERAHALDITIEERLAGLTTWRH